ncbi:MAG: acyl carrier protein [Lachnospiraceae bacterium]|nr:acyl carrier protein [Lachnospiraceae bacterium]MBQ1514249.1 acyl carrier protein [Lachnospiraceae bacterium]MBQ3399863.1 acyl carrier protein [Lachnospiraceae bacterium]
MDNFEKVRDIIAEQLSIDPAQIVPEATFTEDLGADSLDAVEMVMAVEEEFDISVPDEALENIKTVADLLALVEEYL